MKSFFILLILSISSISLSQNEGEWQLFKSVSGVDFYQKETDCTPDNIPSQKGVLIKIINTNEVSASISWELDVWYNDVQHKANIRDGENEYHFTLDSNEKVEGSCNVPNGALYIFKEFIVFKDDTKMTKFEFRNIKIQKD